MGKRLTLTRRSKLTLVLGPFIGSIAYWVLYYGWGWLTVNLKPPKNHFLWLTVSPSAHHIYTDWPIIILVVSALFWSLWQEKVLALIMLPASAAIMGDAIGGWHFALLASIMGIGLDICLLAFAGLLTVIVLVIVGLNDLVQSHKAPRWWVNLANWFNDDKKGS